jgi:cell fate regulator YaaT (PSP1 superfamily)
MPLYVFENEKTGEQREVVLPMEASKTYKKGWRRVFMVPNAMMPVKIDPNNKTDFVQKTARYKTVGDLWSSSEEMSHKRAEKEGKDPIREKWFKDYSKKRNGVMHPIQRKQKAMETAKKAGLRVHFVGDN